MIFNYSISMVAIVITFIISTFLKVVIARSLSIDEMGNYLYLQNIVVFLTMIISFGFNDLLIFSAANINKSKFSINQLQIKCFLLSTISLILIAIIIISLNYLELSKFSTSLIFTIFIVVIFKNSTDQIAAYYQGKSNLKIKYLLELIPMIIVFSIISSIFIFDRIILNTNYIFIIIAISYFPPFYLLVIKIIKIKNKSIRKILSFKEEYKFCAPIYLSGLLALSSSIVPIIIMNEIGSIGLVCYSLSLSIASFIYIPGAAAEIAGFSEWRKVISLNKKDLLAENYKNIIRIGMILSSPLLVVLMTYPQEVSNILFGEKYSDMSLAIRLFSLIIFIFLLNGPSESILKAFGDSKYILYSRILSTLVTFGSIIPLIHWYGLNGAIYSYIISTFMGGILIYFLVLYVKYRIHPFNGKYFLTLLFIVISGYISFIIVEYFQLNHNEILKIIFIITFYSLILLLFLNFFKLIQFQRNNIII
jgi:O-antigen/teichoic acid export membrane protein